MVLISHPGGKKCSSEFVNSLVSSNTIPSSSATILLPSPRRDWNGNGNTTTRRRRGTERERKGEPRNDDDGDNISMKFCGPKENRERFGLLIASSLSNEIQYTIYPKFSFY